jgi:hypothetical protein
MPTFYMENRYNPLLFQSIPENGGGKIRPKKPLDAALGIRTDEGPAQMGWRAG